MDRGRIAAYAAEHHGVITRSALERLGVSVRQARRLVVSGEWQRAHEGVFIVAAVASSFEQRVAAALAAMPAAVLSHHSAAQIHGCGIRGDRVHVSVAHGGRNRLRDVTVHQATLPLRHVTTRHGLATTNLERTIVDLAACVAADELQRCVEDLLVARRTTLDRLEAMYGDLTGGGRPGLVRARTVFAAIDGRPPTESELEARFLRIVQRHALPVPIGQVPFAWAGRERGRVDFWYPSHRLIVELDGRAFHLRAAAFERDRRRDQMALVRGIRTVRFTHRQVCGEAEFVAGVVSAVLTQAAAG